MFSLLAGAGLAVSIVSDYGLDNRAIEDWSPAEAKHVSSSLCVHTSSGYHPASCPMGTGGSSQGGKARLGRDSDHSPHLVPRSWMRRSYASSLPSSPWVCCGTALPLFLCKGNVVISAVFVYSVRKITASLGNVTVRGKKRWKGQWGSKTAKSVWACIV
jgi:hypothetical protein